MSTVPSLATDRETERQQPQAGGIVFRGGIVLEVGDAELGEGFMDQVQVTKGTTRCHPGWGL
jgi:hypothetical protein